MQKRTQKVCGETGAPEPTAGEAEGHAVPVLGSPLPVSHSQA